MTFLHSNKHKYHPRPREWYCKACGSFDVVVLAPISPLSMHASQAVKLDCTSFLKSVKDRERGGGGFPKKIELIIRIFWTPRKIAFL